MLELKEINKSLGKFSLNNINLNVEKGEYFMLLGASGAGKTMLLELISGIINPDSGAILSNNNDITITSIQKRNIGIVYQNQSLFPHMNVFGNIAFPLKCRKYSKSEIQKNVYSLAEETEITHLLKRNVSTLSGGEAQRVAIARALATKPEILLLDEPLSFLDVQLKRGISTLLRKINKNGQTIIHVTHDYKEAFSLSGKIAVLEKGTILQEGIVEDVYQRPKSKFVADFFEIKNFYKGNVINVNNKKYFERENVRILVSDNAPLGELNIWIKSENVYLLNESNSNSFENKFKCEIYDIESTSTGVEIYTSFEIPFSFFMNNENSIQKKLTIGQEIEIGIKTEDICF